MEFRRLFSVTYSSLPASMRYKGTGLLLYRYCNCVYGYIKGETHMQCYTHMYSHKIIFTIPALEPAVFRLIL